ncbi:MAG: aminotransferase class III-fold pyridoxal phosphate-dependent enzyme [Caldilineaceae bacterium]
MLDKLPSALDREIATYVARNPRSQALFERAKRSLPGGNTRTGAHMEPFPLYADSGRGVYLIDLDGHRLLDFVNNNTSLMLGHAHPAVVEALQKQIGRGTGFHRPLALEVEMAELLRERIPRSNGCAFAARAAKRCSTRCVQPKPLPASIKSPNLRVPITASANISPLAINHRSVRT